MYTAVLTGCEVEGLLDAAAGNSYYDFIMGFDM